MKFSRQSGVPESTDSHPVFSEARTKFLDVFGRAHALAAYAPGRVEVLGNHTDYNEGFVLSAAIDLGTFFLAAPREGRTCRCMAGDIMESAEFDTVNPRRVASPSWLNYVAGVHAGLRQPGDATGDTAFDCLFLGNLPLGAGLSSSAALEISCALALAGLYGLHLGRLDLARIGQAAEHDYAGVKCGLLDQITSLFGRSRNLVMTDFRSLSVENIAMPEEACFLMFNTRASHALVDGEYNRRRKQCELAAKFFAGRLAHTVSALRDVSVEEWREHQADLDPETARRALHPIGENERVLKGRDLLAGGDLEAFGRLMFESHASSRSNFENSCRELDFLVDTASGIPAVLGARLSGGGFGGSVVMLVRSLDADKAARAVEEAYTGEFGHPCEVRAVLPSEGAHLL